MVHSFLCSFVYTNLIMVESNEQPEQPQFTADDEKAASEIIAKTNFYEVLGVGKTATDDEIKKAYRKLALKVHPDKNRAPAAMDAFKKVGQAYTCLSDTQKRKHYDMFGSESGQGGGGFSQADFNPDELFRQMFQGQGLDEIFKHAFHQGQGNRNRNANPMEHLL